MIGVDLREPVDSGLVLGVMRREVERVGHAALGERPPRRVARQLERRHARGLGRERERLEVEHDLHVLLERLGHADRRERDRARRARIVMRLDALDPPLDLTDVVEVLIEAAPIRRPEVGLELHDLRRDPVEDAAVRALPRLALRGRAAAAEQLVEHRPRIADHRQRPRRRRPADWAHVNARVAVVATARVVALDRELERRNRRVLAETPRVDLIERDTRVDVGAERLLRSRLREIDRGGAVVIAADLVRRERVRPVAIGVAHDREVLAVRLERGEARRREIEVAPGCGRRPEVLERAVARRAGRAVDDLEAREPRARPRAALRERGHHRIEQRQRDRRAGTAQQRAPRQALPRDEHAPFTPFFSAARPRYHRRSSGMARSRRCRARTPRTCCRGPPPRGRCRGSSACRSTRRAGRSRRS